MPMMRSPFSASATIARYRGSKMCSGRETSGNNIVTSRGKMGMVGGSAVCASTTPPLHRRAAIVNTKISMDAQLRLIRQIGDPLRDDGPSGGCFRTPLLSRHRCRSAQPRAARSGERVGPLVDLILHRLVQADKRVTPLAYARDALAQRHGIELVAVNEENLRNFAAEQVHG